MKTTQYSILLKTLCLILVMTYAISCGQVGGLSLDPKSDNSSNQNPGNPSGPGTTPGDGVKAMKKEVEIINTNKVDVLVVIDNSTSMATEQLHMAEKFSNFIDQLKGMEWQLAITTTDISEPFSNDFDGIERRDGRLLKFGSMETPILNSNMDLESVKKAFAETIQRKEQGNSNEQGIAATYVALERSQSDLAQFPQDASNHDLIRPDAALAVIVVTDSDETPSGNPTFRNQPEGLLSFIKKTWNERKMFSFHSIIVNDGDQACLAKGGNEKYGLSYAELSRKTGGVIGDVCKEKYGDQLTVIGQKVQQLVKTIHLDCPPIDINKDGIIDLLITNSNGSAIPSVSVEASDLIFAEALPLGKTSVEYKCRESLP